MGAERRKKSLSHTSQIRGNRIKSSAHASAHSVGSDFHETNVVKKRAQRRENAVYYTCQEETVPE